METDANIEIDSSPTVEDTSQPSVEGLQPTMDLVEESIDDEPTSETTEQNIVESTEAEKEIPYHERQAWKDMKARLENKLNSQLSERDREINALKARMNQPPPVKKATQTKYKFSEMSDEEMDEAFELDKRGFLADYGRVLLSEVEKRNEIQRAQRAAQQQQQLYQSKQQETVKMQSDYFESNTDALTALQDGSLAKFMTENPLYHGNPVAAFEIMNMRSKSEVDAENKAKMQKVRDAKTAKAAAKMAPLGQTTKAPTKTKTNRKKMSVEESDQRYIDIWNNARP